VVVEPVWSFDDYKHFLPPGGFIHDYVWYALHATDAPPDYHIVCAIALAATAIAPQMDLVFREVVHPLHLFQLIVGDSSASRKTSSIKRATRLAEPVFDRVSHAGARILWPGVSSPEGLLDELAKEPNRLLVLSEWTDMHRLQNAKYWGHAPELFNTIYDSAEIVRMRSKLAAKLVRPRISILGASTRELVNSAVTTLDWHAGKLARYLICCASRPRDRELEIDQDYPGLVQNLQVSLNYILGPQTLPQRASLCQEAWELIQAWHHDPAWIALQDSAPDHIKPSFSRAKEHVLRVAALYEASLRPHPESVVVQPDTVMPAILWVEHCMRGLIDNFSLVVERTAIPWDRIEILLRGAGSKGLSRSQLLRASRLSAKQLDEAILTLRARGEISERAVHNQSGPATTQYWYVQNVA
jgi:hypothetical protein